MTVYKFLTLSPKPYEDLVLVKQLSRLIPIAILLVTMSMGGTKTEFTILKEDVMPRLLTFQKKTSLISIVLSVKMLYLKM